MYFVTQGWENPGFIWTFNLQNVINIIHAMTYCSQEIQNNLNQTTGFHTKFKIQSPNKC